MSKLKAHSKKKLLLTKYWYSYKFVVFLFYSKNQFKNHLFILQNFLYAWPSITQPMEQGRCTFHMVKGKQPDIQACSTLLEITKYGRQQVLPYQLAKRVSWVEYIKNIISVQTNRSSSSSLSLEYHYRHILT